MTPHLSILYESERKNGYNRQFISSKKISHFKSSALENSNYHTAYTVSSWWLQNCLPYLFLFWPYTTVDSTVGLSPYKEKGMARSVLTAYHCLVRLITRKLVKSRKFCGESTPLKKKRPKNGGNQQTGERTQTQFRVYHQENGLLSSRQRFHIYTSLI